MIMEHNYDWKRKYLLCIMCSNVIVVVYYVSNLFWNLLNESYMSIVDFADRGLAQEIFIKICIKAYFIALTKIANSLDALGCI